MIFFDSNVLIDLLDSKPSREGWSEAVYTEAAGDKAMVCNLIVVAEVAAGLERTDVVMDDIADLALDVIELTPPTAMRAAQAFREYRRRGGKRLVILPDFLIAAHAETLGASFVTRDRRLGSYFPDLTLITPETHPNG